MNGTLIGAYYHNVDEKGRLAVPSKIRQELGEPFYMTCMSSDFLCLYSEEEWQKFAAKLNAIPKSAINAQRAVRMIFSSACKCEPDKQGRVLLPQPLRERVGIDKEVATIGASDRAEIWPSDKWKREIEETPKNEPELMASLGEFEI